MRKMNIKTYFTVISAAVMMLAVQSCEKKSVETNAAIEGTPSSAASVSIIPESPQVGTMLRAVAKGGDGFAFRWEKNGEALGIAAETLDTSAFKKGDVIKVVATGGGVETSAETAILNSVPVIKSVTFKPGEVSRGQDLQAIAEGWDPDRDDIQYEYQWAVNGQTLHSERGPVLGGDKFERGDEISVRVTPYDGDRQGAAFEAKAGVAKNTPPRFTSVPPVEFSGKFVYQPKVADQDGDAVSIALVKGPEGMTAEKGSIEWNAKGHRGAFEVTVAADDGNGGQSLQTFELKVDE